jgi:putative membrane protein
MPTSDLGETERLLGAGHERRLHPLSWLFVLLQQLREFALPLIALLFFGRGGNEWWEWAGLGAAALLTLAAVARYYSYRFRIAGDELVIRSGILHRNVRNIPLARIHNVALRRGILHRLLGVAEVRLESAVGGASAEAQMRVLSMRDAHAMEDLVRARGIASADTATTAADRETGTTLLTLDTFELIRLGLTSNRGLLLGAAGVGVFSQFEGSGFGRLIANASSHALGFARGLGLDWMQWGIVVALLAAVLIALLRLISIGLVLLQFHGFRLHERDGRLSVESGLLTRLRSHVPLRKIQHWTVHETLVHRWLGRRSLRVETAALQSSRGAQTLSDPAPIATPAQLDALLTRWLPWLALEALPWQPLHPRAWRRMLFAPLLLTALAMLLLSWRYAAWSLLPLTLVPWWVWRARRIAAHARWALNDRVLAWRSGWLDRNISFAEVGKLQALQLRQSPFDRRHGMARLIADTAGASPTGHRLELPYLPEATARALYTRLSQEIVGSAVPS